MGITPNLLRVLSSAYTKYTSTIFLIKSGVYPYISDKEYIKKAYICTALLTGVVNSSTTKAEKSFFNYDSDVRQLRKDIVKERRIKPGIVTVQMFLQMNNFTESSILEYMYSNIDMYMKDEPSLTVKELKISIDDTLNKLTSLANISKEQLDGYSIQDVHRDITHIERVTKTVKSEVQGMLAQSHSLKDKIIGIDNSLAGIIQTISQSDLDSLEDIDQQINKALSKLIEKTVESKKKLLRTFMENLLDSMDSLKLDTPNLENQVLRDTITIIKSLRDSQDEDTPQIVDELKHQVSLLTSTLNLSKESDKELKVSLLKAISEIDRLKGELNMYNQITM